jgi:hypothetical protein
MDLHETQNQEPVGAFDRLDGIAALLSIYQTELQGVRFPGVDAATLEAGRAQVITAAREVERCAAQLEAAREALRRAREALVATGRRAQAYARVYAEDQPALRERLEAITLPRALDGGDGDELGEPAASTAPARRRGRPPKSATAPSPALFGESARAVEPAAATGTTSAPPTPTAAPTAPTATPAAASAAAAPAA